MDTEDLYNEPSADSDADVDIDKNTKDLMDSFMKTSIAGNDANNDK